MYRSGWHGDSDHFVSISGKLKVRVSRVVGSIPTGEAIKSFVRPNPIWRKGKTMGKLFSKSKLTFGHWVIGITVASSLGVWELPTRPYIPSYLNF